MRIRSQVKIAGAFLFLFIGMLFVASTPCMAELSGIVAYDAGGFYAIAVYDNGTVFGWGDNLDGWGDNLVGVLGVTDGRYVYTPVQLPIDNIKAVSAGLGYVLALKNDGTVWAWGKNTYGNLGDGTTDSSVVPVQVKGLTDVVAVAAGGGHSLALKSDGTVWSWGRGVYGELGTGAISPLEQDGIRRDTIKVLEPVKVNISSVVAIDAGTFFSVALKADGTVWAWGDDRGERDFLGDYTHEAKSLPTRVAIDNVTAVACGYSHTLVLKDGGTVWGWGANWNYQLGTLGDYVQVAPVKVEEFSDAVAIAAGYSNSYAIRSDGSVWAWGSDTDGELGNGVAHMPPVMDPVRVVGIKGVTRISAGNSYCLAIRNDGSLWAWGRGSEGQMGIGQADDMRPPTGPGTSTWISSVPVQVCLGALAELSEAITIFDPFTVKIEQPAPDAPEIEIINSSLADKKWTLETVNPAAYLAYGDGDRLYVFDGNNISQITDGMFNWSVSIPEKWGVCNVWYRPTVIGLTGGGFMPGRSEPVYATGNGYLYLYVTPGKQSSFDVNGYQETGHGWNSTDKSLEWAVVAIAPDGKIAWTLPLTTDAYCYDDTTIRAIGDRIYVFHDYNETVIDRNSKVLFVIPNVSDPAAIDENGCVYVTRAIGRAWFRDRVENGAVLSYLDYRTPGSVVEAYFPNGTLMWSKDVGEPVARQYYDDAARQEYGTLPIYANSTLLLPVKKGVKAMDTRGNELWTKRVGGDSCILFELMPVDSRGNIYLRVTNYTDTYMYNNIFVISADGQKISSAGKLYTMNDGVVHPGARDGIVYTVARADVKLEGELRTLDDLDTFVISAYDVLNDTTLWAYKLPVDRRHNATVDDRILRGLIWPINFEEGLSHVVISLPADTDYRPRYVNHMEQIDVYPTDDAVYVNFRSVAYESPVVLNRTICTYVGDVYSIGRDGEVIYNPPGDSFVRSMAVNNSTAYYLSGDGKLGTMAVGAAGGIALLAALALAAKFFFAGTVARARGRLDKNANRTAVMQYIMQHPGLTSYEIVRGLGLNHGTLRYHLLILGINHRIVTFQDDTKFVRYFPNSGRYSKEEQLIITLMRRESMGRVLQTLVDQSEMTNAEISRALDVPDSITNRYLKELTTKGVTIKESSSDGRLVYTIESRYRNLIVSLSQRLAFRA
ncbi:MAG: hypothetical protein WBZ29_09430 [Methanocella sp.]